MPRHCSAAGCSTRDTRDTRKRGISFHRLPKKDNQRRALWLENSRRRQTGGESCWDPASKYIYFCSQHFEKSCFEIVGFSGYHRLKEGAVPTLFKASPPQTPRPLKPKLAPPERDPSKSSCATKNWRHDPPSSLLGSSFTTDVSCFPRESEDPGAPPAGDHGGVPALPGPSGALMENLLVATVDEKPGDPPHLPKEVPRASSHPVSPSTFMHRLPPPVGAYIQSEHSYQVGSALRWKRRAEAALDALSKAQRQLQACKRREQRLRIRIGVLQRERRVLLEAQQLPKEPQIKVECPSEESTATMLESPVWKQPGWNHQVEEAKLEVTTLEVTKVESPDSDEATRLE